MTVRGAIWRAALVRASSWFRRRTHDAGGPSDNRRASDEAAGHGVCLRPWRPAARRRGRLRPAVQGVARRLVKGASPSEEVTMAAQIAPSEIRRRVTIQGHCEFDVLERSLDIYVLSDPHRHCARCRERLAELARAAEMLGRTVRVIWSVAS